MAANLGLLLAPGAGAGADQSQLVAIDDAVTGSGWSVTRMDFPYRKAGRRAPDRAPVLVASVAAEAASLAERCDALALGGRSMGGRICSMAVADGLVPGAAGLVLVSYPLHPPGKPDRRRDEHFQSIKVPCLFVSGTRDAFATPAELEEATEKIPSPVTHHWVEGRDHSLRNRDELVADVVKDWLASIRSGLPGQASAPKLA